MCREEPVEQSGHQRQRRQTRSPLNITPAQAMVATRHERGTGEGSRGQCQTDHESSGFSPGGSDRPRKRERPSPGSADVKVNTGRPFHDAASIRIGTDGLCA